MRTIGWLARLLNVMGPRDYLAICFMPTLTMHLINWPFCFNALLAAPGTATPRGKAAENFELTSF